MIDDTTKEIVYRDYVDISVAVATPRVGTLGVLAMVPVALDLGWLYTLSQHSLQQNLTDDTGYLDDMVRMIKALYVLANSAVFSHHFCKTYSYSKQVFLQKGWYGMEHMLN